MADSYTPQVGDTVRIVIEDTVTGVGPFGAVLAEWRYLADSAVVSIEKVEPPVTQYIPGDVIRLKTNGDIVILLTEGGGYAYVGTGQILTTGIGSAYANKLTSEYFDKIDVT